VAGALRRAGYSGCDVTLVIAVSGGPDSSALLHCLCRLKERHQLLLHVAHLNHNFRGEEAYADARFVSALARELGLDATVEERDVLAYQQQRRISSFEQAARELRYTFLAEVAENIGAAAVATGHTSDDVAETVLLHILRGSGIHGLRAMPELSSWPWPQDDGRLRLFRPMLRATKAEAISYCDALGKEYRDDSGNYLLRFTRNRVRHHLLPLLESEYNPRVSDSLVRLARTAALELDYLEAETDRLWPQVVSGNDGAVEFRQPALTSLHPALQMQLLRRAYSHVTGHTRRLEERHLEAMAALAQGNDAYRSIDLPGGLKLHRAYHRLRLSREPDLPGPFPELNGEHFLAMPAPGELEKVTLAGPWRVTLRVGQFPGLSFKSSISGSIASPPEGESDDFVGQQSWTAYLDWSSLGDWLRVRTRQPGDRFQPLGMAADKKLQDFFTDARVLRIWRDRVPLMVAQRGIAWVVGWRIAHWARVPERESGTGEVVQVTFEL